ncbi:MAG: hypothetical protein IK081_03065 [Lachnospiraceae bacterium]|nr:hypothetical protein [Lachnospiraceae bacterium]
MSNSEKNTSLEVINENGSKVLQINKSEPEVDYMGALDRAAQYVNMANVANTIEKGVKYLVQVPVKNTKGASAELASLLKLTENGKLKLVDQLPINQTDQGNPYQDICNSYHNIVMQQQLGQIAETVSETYETIKMMAVGQHDDRLALIESGKEQILLAMSIQDEEHKKDLLRSGAHDLLLGKEQIGKALARKVENFKALPDGKFSLILNTLAKPDYLSKKDDEVEAIQDCYSMYVEATKMLATAYAYAGETGAVEQTFKKSASFLKDIDFSAVKTIRISHKDADFSDWFFNHPVEYVEAEKRPCLEAAKEYDYVQIEVSGEDLLEVLKDGGKEFSETEAE